MFRHSNSVRSHLTRMSNSGAPAMRARSKNVVFSCCNKISYLCQPKPKRAFKSHLRVKIETSLKIRLFSLKNKTDNFRKRRQRKFSVGTCFPIVPNDIRTCLTRMFVCFYLSTVTRSFFFSRNKRRKLIFTLRTNRRFSSNRILSGGKQERQRTFSAGTFLPTVPNNMRIYLTRMSVFCFLPTVTQFSLFLRNNRRNSISRWEQMEASQKSNYVSWKTRRTRDFSVEVCFPTVSNKTPTYLTRIPAFCLVLTTTRSPSFLRKYGRIRIRKGILANRWQYPGKSPPSISQPKPLYGIKPNLSNTFRVCCMGRSATYEFEDLRRGSLLWVGFRWNTGTARTSFGAATGKPTSISSSTKSSRATYSLPHWRRFDRNPERRGTQHGYEIREAFGGRSRGWGWRQKSNLSFSFSWDAVSHCVGYKWESRFYLTLNVTLLDSNFLPSLFHEAAVVVLVFHEKSTCSTGWSALSASQAEIRCVAETTAWTCGCCRNSCNPDCQGSNWLGKLVRI